MARGAFYSGTVNGVAGTNMLFRTTASDTDTWNGQLVSDAIDQYTWSWNFGDGQTSGPGNLPATSHQYAAPGVYTVTVTVEDVGIPYKDASPGRATISVRVIGGASVVGADKLPLFAHDSPTGRFMVSRAQPSGTVYSWAVSEGADKARVTSPADATEATVQATSPSATRSDVAVQCTLSLGDPGGFVTDSQVKRVYSYKVSHVEHAEGALQQQPPPPSLRFSKGILLTFRDQFGDPCALWPVGESWSVLSGVGYWQMASATGSNGAVLDTWSNECPSPGQGTRICWAKQTLYCGYWTMGGMDAVDRKDYDTPSIIGDWTLLP